MKAIVSGGTGFVGRAVVQELLLNNIEVILLARHVPKNLPKGITVIQYEFGKNNTLDKLPEPPDLFFHFAWEATSGQERRNIKIQLQNVLNTSEAIEVASKMNCKRFIYAGSIMEYEVLNVFFDECSSIAMEKIYSTSKMMADLYARILAENHKMDYINVLISNIYGPGEYSERFINSVLRKMYRNEEIKLSSCEQMYDFIYIDDAAKAIFLSAINGKPFAKYYIGNACQRRLKDFVIDMQEVTNTKSELLFGSIDASKNELDYSKLNCDRLFREMGFNTQVGFKEGIMRTYESLRGKESHF